MTKANSTSAIRAIILLLLIGSGEAVLADEEQNTGLSLDALMGNDEAAADNTPARALGSMAPPAKGSAGAASLSLDDIYAGRQAVKTEKASTRLAGADHRLAERCRCTQNVSCFNLENRDLSQSPVLEAAKKAGSNLNNRQQGLCQEWKERRNPSAATLADIETQLILAEQMASELNQLDNAAKEIAGQLRDKDREIRTALAKQESGSGFDWGKALAMSVGVVAGGIDQLDTESQAKILGGIISDSISGNDGTAGLQGAVNAINAGGGSGGVATSGGVGQGLMIDEQYQFSCPMGGSHSIKIQAKSRACGNAMREYARTASCNLIDEMQSAQDNYYQACASEMYK